MFIYLFIYYLFFCSSSVQCGEFSLDRDTVVIWWWSHLQTSVGSQLGHLKGTNAVTKSEITFPIITVL